MASIEIPKIVLCFSSVLNTEVFYVGSVLKREGFNCVAPGVHLGQLQI